MTRPTVPSLRARLERGDRLVGGLVRMPCEELVEMLAVAELDFVLIDCEHGPADVALLRHHVTAAESFGLPVVVRVGEGENPVLLRALDLGVRGVVGPHVDTVADADALVRAVRYPPRGTRGFATYSRSGGYGRTTAAEHVARADDVLVVAMLESPRAVRDAAEVLAVDGVDACLVGTSDLGASRGDDDPPLADLLAAAHAATASTGRWRADLAGTADEARRSLDDGAHLVVYNLTQAIMRTLAGLRV